MSMHMPNKQAISMKVKEWLQRYIPSEIAAITTAYIGFFYVLHATGNHTAASLASAMSENIGFYGVMLFRECFIALRTAKQSQTKLGFKPILAITTGLIVEFGPSELLDSLVVRPITIGLATLYFGSAWGVLIGKLAADVSFFIPAILIYEFKKNYLAKKALGALVVDP